MFCKYCGKEIPDNSIFCPGCGRQVGNPGQPAGNAGQPAGNTGRTTGNTGRIFGAWAGSFGGVSGTGSNVVNDFCKSTIVLVFTIIVSAQFVFNVTSIGASFLDTLEELAVGFLCVCLWLVYINSLQNRSSKTGFLLLRFGIPIYLVIRVIVIIVSIVSAARYSYGAWKAVYIIGYLIALVLCLVAYYGLFITADGGYKILDGRDAKWDVRMYALVTFIILAAFVIFSDIFVLALFGYFLAAFFKIAFIVDMAVYVFAAVLLVMLRRQNGEIRR